MRSSWRLRKPPALVIGTCRVLIGALISIAAFCRSGTPFEFAGKPGPHAVGLKIIEQYDYSRTYGYATNELGEPYRGERARPLQTLIWYPAAPGDAKPMTVGDYVDLWATETRFGRPNLSTIAKEWRSAMSRTLTMPLRAVHDAPAISKRFPVVVYAPSFSAMSWENADLCEHLASHGYVVIASPSIGATTHNMTSDLAGVDAQARDISFLIGYAQTLPDADVAAVAVMGFSWGGLANLFAAARDNRIDALVALDGSLRYFPGLVRHAGDVRPEQMTIPLLYFAARWTLEEQARHVSEMYGEGPNVLNAWMHGDLITVHMLGLTHHEFSSMYQRNENTWWKLVHLYPSLKADYGREDGIEGYALMACYALAFLDAYLKQDAVAMAFLKKTPAQNGVPRHVMAVSYRAAEAIPISFDSFRAEIGRQGFGRVADIYAALRKAQPDFKLDEMALNAWSQELIDGNHLHEAIAVLKLSVQLYPDSGYAYAGLAEAYRSSGQKPLAIDSYQKALEKNPLDADVKKKLQDLQGGT